MPDWYDVDYRSLRAGAFEMVIRRYVNFHDLNSRLKPHKHEGEPVNENATNKKVDIIEQEAVDLTSKPKHHFYFFVNYLYQSQEYWSRILSTQEGCLNCYERLMRCSVGYMLWFVPFSSTEKPTFEKFGAFLDPCLDASWGELIYAKETAEEGDKNAWLSIEKTVKRGRMCEGVQTKTDWAVVFAKAKDDSDELLVLKEWKRKTVYQAPTKTKFTTQVIRALLFFDLSNQIKTALSTPMQPSPMIKVTFGFSQRFWKTVFYIFFGFFNWLSIMIQLAFPISFVALLFVIPACY